MTTYYSASFRRLGFLLIITSSIFYTGCAKNVPKDDNPNIDEVLSSNPHNNPPPPEYVIDQSYTQVNQQFFHNFITGPLGQEFIPDFFALDAVELKYDDASCSLTGSNGGDFKVVIHKGSITGPILGTSNTIHFPNCFFGTNRFDFPAFIPLVPGDTYVIEPVYVSGHTSSFFHDLIGTYPDGRMIISGVIQPSRDLWFTEGLFTFIARTKEQGMHGGWRNYVRADGTTFRNQGEFMRYINGHD